MKYENVDFNSEWAASKTVEEFIEHESHHGFSEDQLREVHALCVKMHAPVEEVKPQKKRVVKSLDPAEESRTQEAEKRNDSIPENN